MANEVRLIDLDDIFPNRCFYVNRNDPEKSLDELIRRINNAPTVDAVPVVRCRDCKHYDKDALWCNINSAQFTESHYNWYADDFCSYGQKMDGDGNE